MSYGRGFEGAAYQTTKNLDITEIAKRIRVNLRNAQDLGSIPTEMTYTVKISRYAGGQSLDVALSGMPDTWAKANENAERHFPWPWLTREAAAVKQFVEEMLSMYNRDDSDVQSDYFDVHFHSSVTIVDERAQRFEAQERYVRAEQKKAAAERKAAGLPTRGGEAQASAARVANWARREFGERHPRPSN